MTRNRPLYGAAAPDVTASAQDFAVHVGSDAGREPLVFGGGDLTADDAVLLEWPGGFTPVAGTRPAQVWTSALAVIGLVLSVVGVCATLTGRLALEGFVLGAVGVLISIGGVLSAARPGMTGQGVAGVGIFGGLTAMTLAVVAMTGLHAWLNSGTDAIGQWHLWLVGQWPWLDRWS